MGSLVFGHFPSFSNAIFLVLKLWSFNFQQSFVFFLASGLAEVVQDLLLNGLQLSDTSFSIMEQWLLQPGGFAVKWWMLDPPS
jgi:hypothetical protein